jgi:hypothetical protein
MYPAQALVDGLYTYQDLTDAIDIDGIEFTKLNPPQFIGGVNQYYINTSGEYLGVESMPSDSVWAYEGGNNACLLNDSGWEDRFANSYTVTDCEYAPVVGATVTRVSLCIWQGTYLDPDNPYAPEPQNIYIIYCPGDFIGCGGSFFENPEGIEIPYFYAAIDIGGSGGLYAKKTPYANTPSGTYNFEPALGGIITFS